jgi:hypothetical protein
LDEWGQNLEGIAMAGSKEAAIDMAGSADEKAAALTARNKLSDKQLAKAVIARTLRPRVGEVRRLAEAVLRKDAPKPKKKARRKKEKSGKLAKLPRSRK